MQSFLLGKKIEQQKFSFGCRFKTTLAKTLADMSSDSTYS